MFHVAVCEDCHTAEIVRACADDLHELLGKNALTGQAPLLDGSITALAEQCAAASVDDVQSCHSSLCWVQPL